MVKIGFVYALTRQQANGMTGFVVKWFIWKQHNKSCHHQKMKNKRMEGSLPDSVGTSFFRSRFTSFHTCLSPNLLRLSHCLISFSLFPWASIFENIRAWVPHVTMSYSHTQWYFLPLLMLFVLFYFQLYGFIDLHSTEALDELLA